MIAQASAVAPVATPHPQRRVILCTAHSSSSRYTSPTMRSTAIDVPKARNAAAAAQRSAGP